MLREAISASNDDACLDACRYLGAEFDDAPPEVRAAVAVRSRRLPEPNLVRAAWSGLPAGVRDQIGETALLRHFYALVHQRPDQGLSLEAGNKAATAADTASVAMDHLVMDALPALYGTDVSEPAWALSDTGLALALQVGSAAEADLQTAAVEPGSRLSPREATVELHTLAFPEELAGLSPAQSAIVLHRACWRALQANAASLLARGEWEERSELSWPSEQAEDEALMDLLMVSCRDRADAEAMLSHLTWYLQAHPQHPKRAAMGEWDAALIAVRLRDFAMILERDVAAAATGAAPGAMADLIAQHRAAWSAYLAEPAARQTAWDRYWVLKDAVGEASGAVLLAPCADRAEAAAFVQHAEWVWAEFEAAGERLADGFTTEAQQMRARAGDLAWWLGEGRAVASARV